jgi:hypothetical protein
LNFHLKRLAGALSPHDHTAWIVSIVVDVSNLVGCADLGSWLTHLLFHISALNGWPSAAAFRAHEIFSTLITERPCDLVFLVPQVTNVTIAIARVEERVSDRKRRVYDRTFCGDDGELSARIGPTD